MAASVTPGAQDATGAPATCHDCGCAEGALHDYGCDMENCPFCGGQLLSCSCAYHQLGLYDASRWSAATEHLPPAIYRRGLTDAQWRRWTNMLERKGRYPYIRYPVLCALCGETWPEFFRVPDEDWQRAVPEPLRRLVLCYECYDRLVRLTAQGPAPVVEIPTLCQRCGALNPEPFDVTPDEWQRYIEPRRQAGRLCRSCYDEIRRVTDVHR